MERENFEDKFKNAFGQAEVAPGENVWNNVELELAKADGAIMKRRLAFFQMLAAASVVFALAVGSTSLYFFRENLNGSSDLSSVTPSNPLQQLSTAEENAKTIPGPQSAQVQPLASNEVPVGGTGEKESGDAGLFLSLAESTQEGNPDVRKGSSEFNQPPLDIAHMSDASSPTLVNDMDFTVNTSAIAAMSPLAPSGAEQAEADPVALMMAKLNEREKELQEIKEEKNKKKKNSENLWTSVGFAAGSFNSIIPGTGSPISSASTLSSANTGIAQQEANATGVSYTMGVNMGTRIASKWVVQGGVNYMTQSSDYTAQAAIGTSDFQSFRPASINELEKINSADGKASARVVSTAPYNVNNSVRYLSVPLQAGYLVLERKFGLQLNAGISTDVFLHNNKTAEGANMDQIDQGRGADSPYRDMNFSGLVGTELSYRFNQRYRVSLNPGIRYPLSSIYKTDVNIQSTPVTFDVGLRFRYIFH